MKTKLILYKPYVMWEETMLDIYANKMQGWRVKSHDFMAYWCTCETFHREIFPVLKQKIIVTLN